MDGERNSLICKSANHQALCNSRSWLQEFVSALQGRPINIELKNAVHKPLGCT